MSLEQQFHQHALDDERHFSEINVSIQALQEEVRMLREELKPLTEAYDGVLFSRKFLVGLSTVIIAIGAIGAGVVWLINASIHR